MEKGFKFPAGYGSRFHVLPMKIYFILAFIFISVFFTLPSSHALPRKAAAATKSRAIRTSRVTMMPKNRLDDDCEKGLGERPEATQEDETGDSDDPLSPQELEEDDDEASTHSQGGAKKVLGPSDAEIAAISELDPAKAARDLAREMVDEDSDPESGQGGRFELTVRHFIRGFRPLTVEEQITNGTHEGPRNLNPVARERLIRSALPFVLSVVRSWARLFPHLFFDLIQQGNLGLIEAAYRYDGTTKNTFCTYSVYWINAMIKQYVLRNFRLVKFGTTQTDRRIFWNLKRAVSAYFAEGKDPDYNALALRFGRPVEELRIIEARLGGGGEFSLDQPIGDEEDGNPMLSRFFTDEVPADLKLNKARYLSELNEVMDAFDASLVNPREIAIFRERLRLMGTGDEATLKALGERFGGVSRERIRQIEQSVVKKLTRFLADFRERWEIFTPGN